MAVKVGRPDTTPDLPSHTPGTNQGNARGNYEKQAGFLPDGRVTAAAATSIDPKKHEPIDESMPNIPPA